MTDETEQIGLRSIIDDGGGDLHTPVGEDFSPHMLKSGKKPQYKHHTSMSYSDLFGSSGVLDKPAWSDSTQGRAIIRTFSRGVVGSAFMAIAGHYSSKVMPNYEPELWHVNGWKSNFLHTIAYGLDRGPGRLIQKLFPEKGMPYYEREVVRFRPRADYKTDKFSELISKEEFPHLYYPNNLPADSTYARFAGKPIQGRSFGSEIVNVTFDFFMASIGDAMTRNIIQGFDPNVKQSWILDAKGQPTVYGKGEWHWGKFFKHIAKTSWRVVSYNAGEDWAAAIPYIYQMKWQRQVLSNHVQPGFKRSVDSNINGAIASLNAHGEVVPNNFQLAGALDLHARFVGYNWYTLMYREGYDAIARGFHDWSGHGFNLPTLHLHHPVAATVGLMSDTVRYITKSFIKANLYMNPAMLAFWPMRVSQSAWRGQYEMRVPGNKEDYRRLRMEEHGTYPRAKLLNDTAWPHQTFHHGEEVLHGNPQPTNPNFVKNIENPHAAGIRRSLFESALNPFGWASYKMGSGLTRAVDGVFKEPGNFSKKLFGEGGNLKLEREKLLRNYVDIATSYTPYMWAKMETAIRVDDRKNGQMGQMDKSIYGLMDNIATFNISGIGKSLKDIKTLALNEEKELIVREGGPAEAANDATVAATALRPVTTIDAKSILRDVTAARETLKPSKASNDASFAANHLPQKQWANGVVGRNGEDAPEQKLQQGAR